MKHNATLAIRFLLGLIFFVFGLNGFLQFIPVPPPSTEAAGAFMGGLFQAGYFFPMIAIVEIIVGVMLLSGFYIPLALLFLAPVTVNIFLYHLFLDPAGLGMAVVVIGGNLFLGWSYLESYAGVLQAKPKETN